MTYNYFITYGKKGFLVGEATSNTPLEEGQILDTELYRHRGKPGINYTEKNSEYDIWSQEVLQWVKNPEEEKEIQESNQRKTNLQWFEVRKKRNNLLSSSDWTQLPDVYLYTKENWATYRQELRDITNQTDPFNIVWPNSPPKIFNVGAM